MSGDVAGKIVVITGASTGLGRAIAVETAGRGAEAVVINYARSADEAERIARGENVTARRDEAEEDEAAEAGADCRVRIPIADAVDSLNVAVAVGIVLSRLAGAGVRAIRNR